MIWEFEGDCGSYQASAFDERGERLYAVHHCRRGIDYVLWDCRAGEELAKSPCPLHLMANAAALHEAL